MLEELKGIIEDFPGETPLELKIGPRIVRLGPGYRVNARNAAPPLRQLLRTPAPAPVAALA